MEINIYREGNPFPYRYNYDEDFDYYYNFIVPYQIQSILMNDILPLTPECHKPIKVVICKGDID